MTTREQLELFTLPAPTPPCSLAAEPSALCAREGCEYPGGHLGPCSVSRGAGRWIWPPKAADVRRPA